MHLRDGVVRCNCKDPLGQDFPRLDAFIDGTRRLHGLMTTAQEPERIGDAYDALQQFWSQRLYVQAVGRWLVELLGETGAPEGWDVSPENITERRRMAEFALRVPQYAGRFELSTFAEPPDLSNVEIPDGVPVREVRARDLARGWRAYPAPPALQDMGSAWARELGTAVLSVPSAVVPQERNFVLNPLHPDFARLRIGIDKPAPPGISQADYVLGYRTDRPLRCALPPVSKG